MWMLFAPFVMALDLSTLDLSKDLLVTSQAGVVSGLNLERPGFSLENFSGIAAPIKLSQLPDQPVGWALSGQGTLALTPPERYAIRFANQQVLNQFSSLDAMRPVATSQPFHSLVTEVLLLGAIDLTVGDLQTPLAQRKELQKRLEQLEKVYPIKKLLLALSTGDHSQRILDVLTDTRYGRVDPASEKLAVTGDHYITASWNHDCVSIGSFAENHAAQLMGANLWNINCSVSVPSIREVSLESRVQIAEPGDAFHLDVQGSGILIVEARRVTRSFVLDLDGLRQEGEALPQLTVPAGVQVQVLKDGPATRAIITPSHPLQPGDQLEIGFTWRDTWPWSHATNLKDAGRSSGPQTPYPSIVGDEVGGGQANLQISVPDSSKIQVMMGGAEQTQVENGLRWTRVEIPHRSVSEVVEVGNWLVRDEPPMAGLPAINVRVFPEEADTLKGFAPLARSILGWAEGLLPALPDEPIDIIQLPDTFISALSTSHYRQVLLTQALIPMRGPYTPIPHDGEHLLAHELMHQYWGSLVRSQNIEDTWIKETLAEVYADLFSGAAWGPEALNARIKRHKEDCEAIPKEESISPLRESPRSDWGWPALYDCGPYVIEAILRPIIGDNALLGTLDRLARESTGKRLSSTQLFSALDASTPEDLSIFFESWFKSGMIPTLKLDWKQTDHQVHIDVRSSVPFGRLLVPVEVEDQSGRRTLQVLVQDGIGVVEETVSGKASVILDPKDVLLRHGS